MTEELIAVNQDSPLVGSARRIVGGDLTFPCGEDERVPTLNWTKTTAPVNVPAAVWEYAGGADATRSRLPGEEDIRSGSPGQVSMAVVATRLASLGHAIGAATVSFQYVSGYHCLPGDCPGAANVSLALVDAVNHTVSSTI